MADHPLRILVALNVAPELLEQVRAVDPARVEVRQLGAAERRLMRGEAGADPGARASLDEALSWAQALVCDQRAVTPDLPERAPGLRWVQVTNAGIDYLVERGLHRVPILISDGSGIHGVSMSEYVLLMCLAFARRLDVYARAQARHEWAAHEQPRDLAGATLGIVGLGAIGRAVARAARGMGMRTVGLRRSGPGHEADPDVERVYGPERLHAMLGESDYVLVAAPLTEATRHMIGEAEFRAMKRTAVIVNVARGGLIDERALVRALREGWIAGAGLDVFEEEPLPPDSLLWDMPNVFITPHMAGNSPHYFALVIDLFCRSLRRVLDGGEPLTPIDVDAGY